MTGVNNNWEDKNGFRDYPFLVDSEKCPHLVREFLKKFFRDLSLVVNGEIQSIWVSSIFVRKEIVTIAFSDIDGNDLLFFPVRVQDGVHTVKAVAFGDSIIAGTATVTTTEIPLSQGRYVFSENVASVLPHCVHFLGGAALSMVSASGGFIDSGALSVFTAGGIRSEVIDGEIDGRPAKFVQFYAVNRQNFQDPCSPKNTICECSQRPVGKINSVYPDINGNINIVSETPELYVFIDEGKIVFSFVESRDTVCQRPEVPDQDGRLPSEIQEGVAP